mmetsp:Transcript_20835/g.50962  ORF Transcript_20835/g.50962 Transcript_20835/m.50962 type:complete len:220 (-) Transcript_20835:107-766(-)
MRVLVLGASGRSGQAILREAQASATEHTLFALVRTPSKLPAEIAAGCAGVIQGDAAVRGDVVRALREAQPDVVVTAIGSSSLGKENVREVTTRSLVEAMEDVGGEVAKAKVVALSSMGASESMRQTNLVGKILCSTMLRNVMADHTKQEQVIWKALPAEQYLVIRPPSLTDKEPLHKYHVTPTGRISTTHLARADVAHFIVKQLDGSSETWFGQNVAIG